MKKLLFIFSAVLLLCSCALKSNVRDVSRKQKLLAIMPFENFSNDVKGPEVTRQKIYEVMKKAEYNVMDLETTDRILRDLGVTDGGQLKAVELGKLAAALGTSVFVTGEVKEYFQGASLEVVPFGFCFKRQVKLLVEVRDVTSGKLLFSKEQELVTREALDKQVKKEKKKNEKKDNNSGEDETKKDDKEKEEKEPTFFERLFGGILVNAVADTIYSGAEAMAVKIADEIVGIMPYFYEN